MRMTASYKFNDGPSNPTQCFPVRTSLTRRTQGGGHWLVAYRKAEESNYKNVCKRAKEMYKKQKNSGAATTSAERTLDKLLLLQLHYADEPFELSSVDISEQYLNAVIDEDFNLFHNVIDIDASINFLSLGHFSRFVSLRQLNLSLNRLQDVTFDPVEFPHLEVLDLSYNNLSTDAIAAIGRLPCLRVLHLTGNQIHHLPPKMGSSSHNTTPPGSTEDTTFKCLQDLMLDDNKLSSNVFNCLANLRRLKYLNLQGNLIFEVPLLELLNHLSPLQTSTQHKEAEENISDNLLKLVQIIQQKDWDEYKEASFPFPELEFLNLSGNKIAEEERLLAVALFPMLSEIDISSNPLTTRRSGDPPLLTYYLQDRLGVKIKRKDEHKVKTSAKLMAHDQIPNLSKMSQRVDAETKKMLRQLSFDQTNKHETARSFFVTETVDDIELDLKTPLKDSSENQDSSEKFSSYKLLTDVKPDLTTVEPIGIQTAVRMLEHTLKNLNVYRDSKPKLDSIQTPYREREKRIRALPPPPALPLKQQSKKLDQMIEEIKQSRTMREIPLSKVIKQVDGNKEEYMEAVSLLKDMKAKYTMVHRKTMEQAACLGSEKNTEEGTD